ncbi:MAG TPA: tRNA(Met) cytidine acetyltransferase, partial [Gammaproteobacteria bacterium]|nr:tRNA(Met) cytidine acetyltransferase [Gammaproteobacteria bacterium]
AGFDIDALGAVGGSIRGGGLLLLLMPALDDWQHFDDPAKERMTVHGYTAADVGGRWFEHLKRCLLEASGVIILSQHDGVHGGGLTVAPSPVSGEVHDADCVTADQADAVAAVTRTVRGHRRRPAVLVSDRGRGKSAALGIAAARVLRDPGQRILVTAPRRSAAASVFLHAARLLPDSVLHQGQLCVASSVLEFVAPERLRSKALTASLVMIDEAAALPTPLLHDILRRYSRLAFATTVHGYEGSGRAFELRFSQYLDQHSVGWRRVQLNTPIRWAAGDPLEEWLFRALALNARIAESASVGGVRVEDVKAKYLSQGELATQPDVLEQVFGLMVQAHYRTRPYDLRYLMDAPNVSVVAMFADDTVVAVALLAIEGGFDQDTASAIVDGRRRPRGHLLPESLGVHFGLEAGPTARHARIVRIAVHPAVRCRGLGSSLVSFILESSLGQGLDSVGTTFGATPALTRFWGHAGLQPLRLGVRRGTASGGHALLMLKGLSASGIDLAQSASEVFARNFRCQLADTLTLVPTEVVLEILGQCAMAPAMPDTWQWRDAAAFAFLGRSYEDVVGSLETIVWWVLASEQRPVELSATGGALLVARVLQKRSWATCATLCKAPGRAGVLALLRDSMAKILEGTDSTAVQAEVLRLQTRLVAGSGPSRG